MANRRSILIGLGSLVAGGGALLGTGAFTTVTAERTVNVETTGDASAFLGLAPADRPNASGNPFVEQNDETVDITLENPENNGNAGNASGLNANAKTVFRNLVTVTNNGTQEISSLHLQFISGTNTNLTESDIDNVFSFTISPDTGSSNRSTIANDPDDDDSGADILADGYRSSALEPGQSINFGILIDLLDTGVSQIDTGSSFTLQITAETGNSQ